jgi:hypothetical protein
LLDVAHAHGLLAFLLGPGKRRQQHGRQNRDDGDDHQQFNQGEGRLPGCLRDPEARGQKFGLGVCSVHGMDLMFFVWAQNDKNGVSVGMGSISILPTG